MLVVDDLTCGVEGCEGGCVNSVSGDALCSICGVVGDGGVPFGSSGSVLVSLGGVGGGGMEAGATLELKVSSSVTVTIQVETLRHYVPLRKGHFPCHQICLFNPTHRPIKFPIL